MKGCVYILQDDRGRFYIGSTTDINRRLYQHLRGHTQTTRNMKRPKLVFAQEYEHLQNARIAEKRLKSLKRRDYIEKIVRDGYIRFKP